MIGALDDLIILVGREKLGDVLLNSLNIPQQKDLINDAIKQGLIDLEDLTPDIIEVWTSSPKMPKAEVSLILKRMADDLFNSEDFDTPSVSTDYEALNQAIRRLN